MWARERDLDLEERDQEEMAAEANTFAGAAAHGRTARRADDAASAHPYRVRRPLRGVDRRGAG
jgi:hypothetical protein